MRLIRHFEDVPAEMKGAVIAIGNFDGVHLGHQVVLSKAAEQARKLRTNLGVLTFEPHPRTFFKPDEPPFRLTPFRIKMRHLQDLGVDVAFVFGSDFCYGNKRGGNATVLKAAGEKHGFGVTAVAPQVDPKGAVYSSTLIRAALL